MDAFAAAADFARTVSATPSIDKLRDALDDTCQTMGIRFYALSHHVDFASAPRALRLHNYPDGWEDWYDDHQFGISDPIHRASQCTAQGFYWRDVPDLIPLSRSDRSLLVRGRSIGLGEGVTIPAHVPGESRGSCSFVAETGRPLPDNALLWAQMIGMFAFEGARKLQRKRNGAPHPRISDRQRQCIVLAGKGLSNKAIARALGIGPESVAEHMREARAKLGAGTRTELVVSLLAANEICFDDVTLFDIETRTGRT
jgi:LuxR family quorum-sensing system transcriptional regulator CciR